MSNLELEFEANQLRDVVLFELRTGVGENRENLMRARNILWLVGTELSRGDVPTEKLWDLWQEALDITFHVVLNIYCK